MSQNLSSDFFIAKRSGEPIDSSAVHFLVDLNDTNYARRQAAQAAAKSYARKIEMVDRALANNLRSAVRNCGETIVDKFKRRACDLYCVQLRQLNAGRRTHAVKSARHVAMYLCRLYTELKLEEIGNCFGRSHSAVLHAITLVNQNSKLIASVEKIRTQVKLM